MGRPCVLRRRRYEKSPGRAAWRALAVPHARRFGNRHPVPGSEPLRGHVGSQRVRFLPPVGAGASIPHTLRHLRARASHPCPFSAPARLCRRVPTRSYFTTARSLERSESISHIMEVHRRATSPPRSRERPGQPSRFLQRSHRAKHHGGEAVLSMS